VWDVGEEKYPGLADLLLHEIPWSTLWRLHCKGGLRLRCREKIYPMNECDHTATVSQLSTTGFEFMHGCLSPGRLEDRMYPGDACLPYLV